MELPGLTTTSSRWWAELTYMGHATLSLTLARSKAGSERLPLSPEEGAHTPHRPFSGVRHAPSPTCRIYDPRSSGGLTDLELVSSPANNGL
jgi:hypothetical protein